MWQVKRRPARGRPKTAGSMNKTERAFYAALGLRAQAGEIDWWAFEPLKLRLADKTFYTPDFLVMEPDGRLVFYEVKGFWRDDARVKIKVAASMYWMFRFVSVKKTKRGFDEEEITPQAPPTTGQLV